MTLFILLVLLPCFCWSVYNIGKEQAYDECAKAYINNDIKKFLIEKERIDE